jgi:hypothetical protein
MLGIAVVIVSGCTGQSPGVGTNVSDALDIAAKELGCKSVTECDAFCQANHDVCDAFCAKYPDVCAKMAPGREAAIAASKPNETGPPPLTTCQQDPIISKMKTVINNALATPLADLHEVNWMTKILPSTNPYPGYYYVLSCAFGPAVDDAITAGPGGGWSGEGEPPLKEGEFHYSFGIWDEISKEKGATLGTETPAGLDFSKYQLAIFYTNQKGSQDQMINALPPLAMSEAQAKEYFYTVFKKSFVNLDQKTMSNKGGKFYEAVWHDSDKTNDYWDVQIGEGYIAIGQGKVYTAETALAGNVGTTWVYTGCKPCVGCEEWTKGTALNHDCTADANCKTGFHCANGYCDLGAPGSSTGGSGTGKPGSPCSSAANCDSGLSCTNSVCTAPAGGPPGGAGGPP